MALRCVPAYFNPCVTLCVCKQDRIFFENIGAVKELCKVTGKLEMRINEMEEVNRRLVRSGRTASTKSTQSRTSATSGLSSRSVVLISMSISQSAAEVGPVLNKTSHCQEIPPTTFWHCNPYSAFNFDQYSVLFSKNHCFLR